MGNGSRQAVFLDRDGVLNSAVVKKGRPYPPSGLHELEVPCGVLESLKALKEAGFILIVVTNQPDVARGTQSQETVEAINNALRGSLPLDDIFVCYHDDQDGCECRKPAPGLLMQAASQYNIDVSSSFIVGDRWKDVEAGRRAACTTIMIDLGYGESVHSQPDQWVDSLPEATEWIIGKMNKRES